MNSDPETTSEITARHVAEIVAAAQASADAMREELCRDAQMRVAAMLADAEREAAEIRDVALTRAEKYLADWTDLVDKQVEIRLERLATLSEQLVTQAEELHQRFDAAGTVRRQTYELIASLGGAAAKISSDPALSPERPQVQEESET